MYGLASSVAHRLKFALSMRVLGVADSQLNLGLACCVAALFRGGQLPPTLFEFGRLRGDSRSAVVDLPVDPLLHRLILEDDLDHRIDGADVRPPKNGHHQCGDDRRREGELVADRHPHDSAEIHGGQAFGGLTGRDYHKGTKTQTKGSADGTDLRR